MMKYSIYLFLPFLLILFSQCSSTKVKVLVFTKTAGYRHDCIPEGIEAIRQLGAANGFTVFATEDAAYFKEENLKQYAAVIFLNTTGDVLNYVQQADFERYIQAGGGFVGVHAATDTEYDWPWYASLVGANFESHPAIQQANISVLNHHHPATEPLPETWTRSDEWYNMKNFNPKVKVLMNLDEKSYQGGKMGGEHPISWYHDYDGGRAFYTALGHTKASYSEPLFLQHLMGGIRYAIGYKKKLDYRKATVKRVPAEDRFQVTVLAQDMQEPMQMAILEDERVLIIERHGALKIFEPATGQIRIVRQMNVFSGLEDGLLGMTLDKDFSKNHWIYFFYAHPVDSVQCISRFDWDGYDIDTASEKVLLRIPVQRDQCCHSGGCLRMDSQGDLWASLGDNTNPFESDGFNPIDERPGRAPWDAQKSSANTKDLRGKIIRIHPEPDGSYSIPEGNLFPDTTVGRPEIYVMGCRNPFRIWYDDHRKYLYWGDVGPDSGKDSLHRGPRGYDEFNQAKKPGFFGWPYFIGDNQAYHEYDFTTKISGAKFQADNPVNNSPNNTGSAKLPPAQKAFIYYPYDKSEKFPLLATGGRTAMAGPTFYKNNFKEHTPCFPDYFEGNPIQYEWMRNWFFVVHLDHNGDYLKMDPFLPNLKMSRPVDMQFGHNGALYVLEYGTTWNARNADARLIRIDYVAGNRNPIASITADKLAGAVPMRVQLCADSSYDMDGQKLKYLWEIESIGWRDTTTCPQLTLKEAGEYDVMLTVTDEMGGKSVARQILIAGNEPPEVSLHIKGNNSFFWENMPLSYEVLVKDKEDLLTGGINPASVSLSIDRIQGFDLAKITTGHQPVNVASVGKSLLDASDCKSCHAPDQTINGPSYRDIARRYKGAKDAVNLLANKVIKGGGGVWGIREMAAHPQLSLTDATQMVQYILSTGLEANAATSAYPPAGSYRPVGNTGQDLVFTASYTDRGTPFQPPVLSTGTLRLKPARFPAVENDGTSPGLAREERNGVSLIGNIRPGSWLKWNARDLTDIRSAEIELLMPTEWKGSLTIELHLNSPEGPLAGASRQVISKGLPSQKVSVEIKPVTGRHDIYIVFKSPPTGNDIALGAIGMIRFDKI